jgi:hypothetical protein
MSSQRARAACFSVTFQQEAILYFSRNILPTGAGSAAR